MSETPGLIERLREWLVSVADCDPNEIVADGGITAGMVVCQEAREQIRRIDKALIAKYQPTIGRATDV